MSKSKKFVKKHLFSSKPAKKVVPDNTTLIYHNVSVVVPCFGFGNGSGILRLITGNVCQPCDSDAQCLGDAYFGYCNPKINSTIENAESYSQCVIRTLLASGSHLPSRQGKCQLRN